MTDSRSNSDRSDDNRALTGISLSGGGVRAAAFSLGVLQELQERLGLLSGAKPADLLAVVSGGSYIGATYAIGGMQRAAHPEFFRTLDPVADNSPEALHILNNGRYLAGQPFRFIALVGLNVAALVMLFVWAGTIAALWAFLADLWRAEYGLPELAERLLESVASVWEPALVVVYLAAWGFMLRSLFAEGWRRWLTVPAVTVVLLVSPRALSVIARYPIWRDGSLMWLVSALLAGVVVATLVARLIARIRGAGFPARVLNRVGILMVRGLGLAVFLWSAALWHEQIAQVAANSQELSRAAVGAGVAALASIALGWIFSLVLHRAPLHREYRRRLASTFAVTRDEHGLHHAYDTLLSDLEPPTAGDWRFPRLLVCATANIAANVPRLGNSTFVPFVFSPDVCAIPGLPGGAFPTKQLELGRAPTGLFGEERLISLFTAVAATGAAIAPSMGRFTVPTLRPLIAAANIRLGRWLPNPLSFEARRAVATRKAPGRFLRTRLGGGYDELVPELLGFSGVTAYISDGGHYDNLGLLALIAARCRSIWCVDSSPEAMGEAVEIRRVLALAQQLYSATATIDLDPFRAAPNAWFGATHSIGHLRYEDGTTATLTIVKLGMSAASPPDLRERSRTDRGLLGLGAPFPHHGTFLNQLFKADRMDAYRRLGRHSTGAAVAELDRVNSSR